MIGRDGKPIIVGFQPHELEWIRAAGTLTFRERESAYMQIAALTCRRYATIYERARKLRSEDRKLARDFLEQSMITRRVYVTAPTMTGKQRAA